MLEEGGAGSEKHSAESLLLVVTGEDFFEHTRLLRFCLVMNRENQALGLIEHCRVVLWFGQEACENILCLAETIFHYQPPWRLRGDENQGDGDNCKEELEGKRKPPAHIRMRDEGEGMVNTL